ncbi:MAG: hypothetical protein LZF60_370025 [Nitrospira sp.]|nr:hypothetical protein [Nitrospira sp.]ULA61775.1 MAG: hypothetical protein LZF60_370025 [Nitrospira sp.]
MARKEDSPPPKSEDIPVLLLVCLHLCSLPVGSPERDRFIPKMLEQWSGDHVLKTLQAHPELFHRTQSISRTCLTEQGIKAAQDTKHLVPLRYGVSL